MCQLNRFLDSELWHQYVIKRILHSNMQMNTQRLPRQKFFPNISLRLHTSAWTVETSPYHSSFSLRRIATDQIQYQHCDYKIRLQRRFGAVEERWTLISDYQVQKDTPQQEHCSWLQVPTSFLHPTLRNSPGYGVRGGLISAKKKTFPFLCSRSIRIQPRQRNLHLEQKLQAVNLEDSWLG